MKILMISTLILASCGSPNPSAKYVSDRADAASDYLAEREESGSDYLADKSKNTEDYLYDRGICEMQNGDYCGSSHPGDFSPNVDGTQGPSGSSGSGGASGSTGQTGPSGSNGTNGTNGAYVPHLGPEAVNLGLAANFSLLSKAGITNVPGSILVGDIGSSPISGAAIVALDCIEVTGNIYTVDAAGPACRSTNPLYLSASVIDMHAAYVDAAGRPTPTATELGAGEIGSLVVAPGLYKWGTNVTISTNVTLKGGPDDVWIFQISGDLIQASAVKVILEGGAKAENIFWQVTGSATLGTTSHMEGTILAGTKVSMLTGATLDGRIFAHTEITLQSNTVNKPQ